MRKLILTACIFFAAIFSNAQTIIFLDKGDIFKSPEIDMVVMDKYTFSKYHYTAEHYDSLKNQVLSYDSTIQWMDSITKEVEANYKSLIAVKDKQIEATSIAYSAMVKTLQDNIKEESKLQVDYIKLQQKSNRQRKWRNFFMGTTAVLGGIIYLVVRH